MFTPLRYPGGKTTFFEFFDRVIKANQLHNVNYVEPYAGGAGAALSLLMLEKVDSIVINDLDRAIYAFWKSITSDPERFIEKIECTPVTIEQWRRQSEIFRSKDAAEFELGFASFFLNRTNHSGILNAGPIGGLAQTGKWPIDARYNKSNLIKRIRLIAMYRDRIEVLREDALDVIRRYSDQDDSFLYIDPPYYVKGSSLYLNAYKHEDHVRLAELLNSLNSARWILSYDNVPQVNALYHDFETKFEFSIHYQARSSREGSELIVVSDSLEVPVELFHT